MVDRRDINSQNSAMKGARWLIGLAIAATCGLSLAVSHSHGAEIIVLPDSPKDTPMIAVAGPLLDGDDKKFASVALGLDSATVIFDSPGGSLLAGINIGKAIRLKEFFTLVGEGAECASSCGLAWLGGVKRFAFPGARIGFHAAYVERGGQATESGAGNAVVGAYLNQLGLPQSAVIYLTLAAPHEMQWLPLREAKSHGIELEIIEPTTTENSGATEKTDLPLAALPMSRLEGFDVLGFDFSNMPIRNTTLQECETACAADSSCKAFTYNIPRSACFLKSGGSRVVPNALAVAGYRTNLERSMFISSMAILERTDLPGNDFQKLEISDFEQCLSTCEANPRCMAFTFVKRKSVCWLKDGVSAPLSNRRAVSGFRSVN
jgi:hypothetical protein